MMTIVLYTHLSFLSSTGVLSGLGFHTEDTNIYYYIHRGVCHTGEPAEAIVPELDLLIVDTYSQVDQVLELLDFPNDYLLVLHRSEVDRHHGLFVGLSERYPERRIIPLWEDSDAGPVVAALLAVVDSESPFTLDHPAIVDLFSDVDLRGLKIIYEYLRRAERITVLNQAGRLSKMMQRDEIPYLWRKAFAYNPELESKLDFLKPGLSDHDYQEVSTFFTGLGRKHLNP